MCQWVSDSRPVSASVPDVQLKDEGQQLVLRVKPWLALSIPISPPKSFDVKVVELLAERVLVAPNGPCLRVQPYAGC